MLSATTLYPDQEEKVDPENEEPVSAPIHHRVEEEEEATENLPASRIPEPRHQPSRRTEALPPPQRSVRRRLVVTAETAPFDISYHPGRVLLYSPPRQRQKWGDAQVLPRTNWGDLFFDLFYVASTYNVSNILVDQPNGRGLLYAAGTFLPVMGFWVSKTVYDGRYVFEDDVYHRIMQMITFVVLGSAVLHIQPVAVLSNAAGDSTMFVFALTMVMERLVGMIYWVELYFFGVGMKALKTAALRDIKHGCVSLVFYLAALAVAAAAYFGPSDEAEKHERFLASSYESSSSNASTRPDTTNVPIVLILCGHLVSFLHMAVLIVFCFPGGGKHKEHSVPLNIDFVMHRNGEWTMLMLGESIFSLLTVDVPQESADFFLTFFCGIMTVVLLQFLHFRSQPKHADSHALRRHKNAGFFWTMMQQVYSLALVSLGSSFTFFLEYYAVDEATTAGRRLASSSSSATEVLDSTARFPHEAADLYCASLAIIFFCLDAMIMLHIGLNEGRNRCICKRTKRKNFKGIILLGCRLAVLVVTATLSQLIDDPVTLSLTGLACVFTQLMMRKLGGKYLSHSHIHVFEIGHGKVQKVQTDEGTGEATWPNVTHARAEPSSQVLAP